jgi:hypothetical protein
VFSIEGKQIALSLTTVKLDFPVIATKCILTGLWLWGHVYFLHWDDPGHSTETQTPVTKVHRACVD